MQVERIISKGQLVPFKFMQDAVAASQTNVQLEHENAQLVLELAMPFAGEVVGVSYDLSAAGSAGSLAIGPTVDGTEDADGTITITTETSGYKRIPRGKIPFAAGQKLGAELTTDGSWNGTTADLVVVLWVLVHLEDI